MAEKTKEYYDKVISKFANKETIYVDIRNELNNSINFYGNYGSNLANVQFKDSSQTLVSKNYHDGNGWPVLVLTNADFATNTNDNKQKLTLALPKNIDNNSGNTIAPSIYLSGASFYDDFPISREKFKNLTMGTNFSNTFELGILNNKGDGKIFPYSLRLNYNKRYDIDNLPTVPSPLSLIYKDDYIDNLLMPSAINITTDPADPTNTDTVEWNTLSELFYIGWTSNKGIDFNVRTGLAKDSIGEVAFAYIEGVSEENGETSTKSTHSHLDLENGSYEDKSFFNYLLVKGLVKIRPLNILLPTPVTCLKVDSENGKYSIDILDKSFNDFISLAYTSNEKTIIETTMNNLLAESPCFFIALNHNLFNDASEFAYFEMELGIQGIIFNTSSFTYQTNRINTNIKFYSFDGRNYFTEAYSVAFTNI